MELIQHATISLINFLKLVVSSSLHLRRIRLWKIYHVKNRGNYAIFRETESKKNINEKEIVLIVGFRLKIIDSNPFWHFVFQRLCILTTPFWSGFAGFKTKLWMVDPKTKNYLGMYKWQGKENAKKYVDALAKVLRAVSTKGSVWHEIHDENFEDYLIKQEV